VEGEELIWLEKEANNGWKQGAEAMGGGTTWYKPPQALYRPRRVIAAPGPPSSTSVEMKSIDGPVSCSYTGHTVVLTEDKDVWSWGRGDDGRLVREGGREGGRREIT